MFEISERSTKVRTIVLCGTPRRFVEKRHSKLVIWLVDGDGTHNRVYSLFNEFANLAVFVVTQYRVSRAEITYDVVFTRNVL